MKNASQNLNIIDDSGMEVELKYFSGGSIRLPRGLGNDNLYIGEVITSFFNEHGINIYK